MQKRSALSRPPLFVCAFSFPFLRQSVVASTVATATVIRMPQSVLTRVIRIRKRRCGTSARTTRTATATVTTAGIATARIAIVLKIYAAGKTALESVFKRAFVGGNATGAATASIAAAITAAGIATVSTFKIRAAHETAFEPVFKRAFTGIVAGTATASIATAITAAGIAITGTAIGKQTVKTTHNINPLP